MGICRRVGRRLFDRDRAEWPKNGILAWGADLRTVKKASKISIGMENWPIKACTGHSRDLRAGWIMTPVYDGGRNEDPDPAIPLALPFAW